MSGWRTARRSAWARIGWRHPLLILGGPVALTAAGAFIGWAGLSYLWDTVPHAWLAAVCAAVAVGLMVWMVRRRPGSWVAAGLVLVAVVLLAWAALRAARG